MQKLTPLNQPVSLSKMAYDAIRRFILSGQMKHDEIYNEMGIAKELGISRTPVREALLELSSQGLITFLPRKGLKVNKLTDRDIDEIFEVRKAIELAAVERISKNADTFDLSLIETSLEDMRKAAADKNYLRFMDLDLSFHMAFCELTGNRRMLAIMQNIHDMIHMLGTQSLAKDDRMEEAIREQENILEAVRHGKTMEARVLMEAHLERSKASAEKATG
ncbi:GntR family transcriptional regulator [Desulfonema ishimotonii]|uniref:GntR family transcriptional regulator n=1 Tax=Desulfonema ishimotonii TaxID=45657 RepID=A0A401FQY3_9BACT|nr:GntR family transcriptional regulator [Desulfonema ishimotonii]GBC59371.1 GntR family transcriptional regulator [Desulfonema ishimotonii]